MDGGDLRTIHRGGDLKTISRQHGGFLGLLKMLGLGEVQKEMSDPISKQHVMQRGGFPWALTGLSLLPALLGKGDDTIRSQMSISRDPVMLRGGLSVLPALTKSLPLVKDIAAPLALGALASLGDNVVDKIFGEGMKRPKKTKVRRTKKLRKRRSPRGNVKKLFKQKGKAFASKNLRKVGRRLFDEVKRSRKRLESIPRLESITPSPFTQRLKDSIERATPSSSHIGPSFNI